MKCAIVRFIKSTIIVASAFSGIAAAKPYVEHLARYRVSNPDHATLERIGDRFEIVDRSGTNFDVLVPAERSAEFAALAPRAELVLADAGAELRRMTREDAPELAGYRSYDQVVAHLQEIVEQHPDIAVLDTYGKTSEGRPLYVLKLSDQVAVDEEDEPRLLIDSATHGDELITVEVVLNLLDELVAGYGTDERLTAAINNTAMYFVPVVNGDGFVRRQRYAAGVDPNREYPWPERPTRRPVACIDSLMKLVDHHKFAGSMDIHAHGRMLMHPWAYTYTPISNQDDLERFSSLTSHMAELNRYSHGSISRVIYVAKGSSADYFYWKYGTVALAIELTNTSVPPVSRIPQVVTEAREMTWRFLDHFSGYEGL